VFRVKISYVKEILLEIFMKQSRIYVYTMRYKYKNIIYYKYYIHIYVDNLARVPEGNTILSEERITPIDRERSVVLESFTRHS